MGGAECVVDVQVRQVSQRLGELGIVRFLVPVEAEVLEQDQLAGTELADRVVHAGTERVAGHAHRASQQLRQPIRDGLEPEGIVDLALGTAEVAGQNHAGTALQQIADGGQAGANARVVGDPAVIQRDVQVGAQEDPLAGDVDVANRLLLEGSLLDGLLLDGRGGTHRRAAM